MHFGLSEDAQQLRDGLRDVLASACPPEVVRAAWPGGDASRVDALWRTLGELGLPGLLVAEADGGLGQDDLVAVAAVEQAGYAGVPGPLVETLLAAPLLVGSGVLDAVLAGRARVCVRRAQHAVPYAATSGLVVDLDDGVRLLRDPSTTVVETVDGARAAAVVDGTGEALDADPATALLRGPLLTAAFLLGLARRQVDLTVAYTRDRQQFGAPVGSFQAVKHPLADAVVGTEFAWPAVLRAAHSLGTGDPDVERHVLQAKILASDAAYRVSRVCLQAHGAIGYTVEYDLHLFAKRTWAMARDWGTSAELRRRVAAGLLTSERT